MPKINQEELNKIAVPVPPLAEQRRIVVKVDALMALVDPLEAQLSTLVTQQNAMAIEIHSLNTTIASDERKLEAFDGDIHESRAKSKISPQSKGIVANNWLAWYVTRH